MINVKVCILYKSIFSALRTTVRFNFTKTKMRDLNQSNSPVPNDNKMTYNEFLNKYNTMKNKRNNKTNGCGNESADNNNSDILYGLKSNNSSSSSINSSGSASSGGGGGAGKVSYPSYQEYLKKYETKKFAPVKLTENNRDVENVQNPFKNGAIEVAKPKISVKSELIVQITPNNNNRSTLVAKPTTETYKEITVLPTASVTPDKVAVIAAAAPPPPPPPLPINKTNLTPPKLPSYATLPRNANTIPKSMSFSPRDLLLDELKSKTKRYEPPETTTITTRLQKTTSPASIPKKSSINVNTLPRPTQSSSINKLILPSPVLEKKVYANVKRSESLNNKLSNQEANITTVIPVADNVDSIVKSDPNVKKIVYNTYRGFLGAYNNKANEMISNTTGIIVKEDKGVSKQLESLS